MFAKMKLLMQENLASKIVSYARLQLLGAVSPAFAQDNFFHVTIPASWYVKASDSGDCKLSLMTTPLPTSRDFGPVWLLYESAQQLDLPLIWSALRATEATSKVLFRPECCSALWAPSKNSHASTAKGLRQDLAFLHHK